MPSNDDMRKLIGKTVKSIARKAMGTSFSFTITFSDDTELTLSGTLHDCPLQVTVRDPLENSWDE